MTGRISAEGHLDRLALARRNASGTRPTRDGRREAGWQAELELGFDPTALGEYWLEHCHRFLVDTPSSQSVGVVDDVTVDPGIGKVASIEVSAGWCGRRRFTLPAESVQVILPLERRLLADIPPEVIRARFRDRALAARRRRREAAEDARVACGSSSTGGCPPSAARG